MLNNEKDVNDVTVRALLKIGCDDLSWVLDCDEVKESYKEYLEEAALKHVKELIGGK